MMSSNETTTTTRITYRDRNYGALPKKQQQALDPNIAARSMAATTDSIIVRKPIENQAARIQPKGRLLQRC